MEKMTKRALQIMKDYQNTRLQLDVYKFRQTIIGGGGGFKESYGNQE